MSRQMSRFFAALFLCPLLLCGCGQEPLPEKDYLKTASYPLETDQTLKYWITDETDIPGYHDRSSFPIMQAWSKETGVDIDWVIVPTNLAEQQFNILMASGDLPDIVEWSWGDIKYGAEKAIRDGNITPLNDYTEYMPNLMHLFEENPIYDKMSKTDSGCYYYFPNLRELGPDGYKLLVTSGYMMRQDYLDRLGLPIPQTISQWYTTLKAFQTIEGVKYPLAINIEELRYGLVGAFGIDLDFYQENGVVKYGRIQPAYRSFLEEMHKWFAEGLLDQNAAILDYDLTVSKFTKGESAATFGWIGSRMGKINKDGQAMDPNFSLTAVPFPTLQEGERPKFTPKEPVVQTKGAAVSNKCKHKELAIKFLDFGYGEQGNLLMNYGTEGVSYTMEDGQPTYTELIFNNSNGLSINEAMLLYVRSISTGPYLQNIRYIEQYYTTPEQKAAQELWKETDADLHRMPPITLTAEESEEYVRLIGAISEYAEDMELRFIYGQTSLSEFDQYIQTMYDLGVGRAIELQQNALERYNRR